jgi:hypothetical protein
MSVRATERLTGEIVVVPGLSNSPRMVVQEVDIETKLITTTWFSDGHECQEGLFPASALERAEIEAVKSPAKKKRK